MKGNRLIGYLYVGDTPPNSLAFNSMIDEGIPIQDVSALLRRDLDACAHGSYWPARSVRRQLMGV
ncbi:MAG TPA: hypothetical protein VKR06_08405 [Ktedonosporobacter sp.]|nr:hypothetical protein [Ktedonosporobacter sp.]